jgi:hypothetical protein
MCMATVEEVMALQERVFDLAKEGKLAELRVLLEEHPEVDVDGYKNGLGRGALRYACIRGNTECARLLIDHRADVNAKDIDRSDPIICASLDGRMGCVELLVQNGADVNSGIDDGWTPLTESVTNSHLIVAHYLLQHKADIHYRVSRDGHENLENQDALHFAMRECTTDRTPGIAFAVLCCNTDAKHVIVGGHNDVSSALRDAHIEEYKHVQAYIDEYHRILTRVLSEHVPVDPRFGLGQMGIYQEPLERTLEYLGLSMSNDQVVNASIDGEGGVRRSLIPGHLLNANHWFNKYKKSR